MSVPTEPASRNSVPAEPAELRRDIEEVRSEMANTVNALAYKLDVKGRAQDKTQELKAQATEKVREVRTQAPERAQQLVGSAQQKVQQVVRKKPVAPVGVALAALVLLILRHRRRRLHRR
ncbi:MAG: DUF3618 domain-containing protein [Pseudonocardiales bacterium]